MQPPNAIAAMTWLFEDGPEPSWTESALVAAVVSGVVAVTVALLNGWISGGRERKNRERTVFAEAFAACVAYREFPYVIRRRRWDDAASERVRISEQLRAVQERIAYHTA